MSSTSSTPSPASSGILDGKVPVFVFPVQLDFYYEDQTTHKRLVTIYNPYEFDVTFKVKACDFTSVLILTPCCPARSCATILKSTLWWSLKGKYWVRNVWTLLSGEGGGGKVPGVTLFVFCQTRGCLSSDLRDHRQVQDPHVRGGKCRGETAGLCETDKDNDDVDVVAAG